MLIVGPLAVLLGAFAVQDNLYLPLLCLCLFVAVSTADTVIAISVARTPTATALGQCMALSAFQLAGFAAWAG